MPGRFNPQAAWDLVVGQVAMMSKAETADRTSVLQNLTRAVDWALAHLSMPQRLARRATGEQPILGSVAQLAQVDMSAALHLLDELGRLGGFTAPAPGMLHLFMAEGRLHGLRRNADTQVGTYRSHPISNAEWTRIVEAMAAGQEEDALTLIRSVTKPILCDPAIQYLKTSPGPADSTRSLGAASPSLELDPGSLVAWWPWHIVHAGDGPLGALNDVRWRTRSASSSVQASDPTPALIVDTSFPQARSVIKAWNRDVGGRIFTYDSDSSEPATADLRQSMLEVLTTHRDVTYFGHAVSDPLSAGDSGLVRGEKVVASLDDLESLHNSPKWVTLVACESGRSNMMLAGVSPAHSLAAAGVREIIGTLWPIEARLGMEYLQALFATRPTGEGLELAWREISRSKQDRAAAFMYMGSGEE